MCENEFASSNWRSYSPHVDRAATTFSRCTALTRSWGTTQGPGGDTHWPNRSSSRQHVFEKCIRGAEEIDEGRRRRRRRTKLLQQNITSHWNVAFCTDPRHLAHSCTMPDGARGWLSSAGSELGAAADVGARKMDGMAIRLEGIFRRKLHKVCG